MKQNDDLDFHILPTTQKLFDTNHLFSESVEKKIFYDDVKKDYAQDEVEELNLEYLQ